MFFTFLIIFCFSDSRDEHIITKVISPAEFVLENGENYVLSDIDTFSADYTEKNKYLAKTLNITEDEAFILGNLGKYHTKNLLEGRKIKTEKMT